MFHSTKKLSLLVLAIAASALLAAGCGSSGSNSSTASNSSYGAYGAAKTSTKTQTASAGSATVATKNNAKLGTILAGNGGKTLYLFEADKNGKSACDGACAAAWPPAIANGSVKASGDAVQSKLGTVKRSDGTMQITYAGHPLYYYVNDQTAADATGNGVNAFGAEWYALTPAGKNAE